MQSSTTARMRKRRPSVIWSETKSRLQRWLAARRLYRPPRADRPLAPAAAAHRQPLFAVDPLNPLLVDRMTLAPQQHMQPSIAEPSSFLGQGLQPLAQCAVVRPPGR